jgi:hypothetical protein
MTVEVCVKAAVGHPDTLGDCECPRRAPPVLPRRPWVDSVLTCSPIVARSLLPEGAAHAGGEEGALPDEAHRRQQQAQVVRPSILLLLLLLPTKLFHSQKYIILS